MKWKIDNNKQIPMLVWGIKSLNRLLDFSSYAAMSEQVKELEGTLSSANNLQNIPRRNNKDHNDLNIDKEKISFTYESVQ